MLEQGMQTILALLILIRKLVLLKFLTLHLLIMSAVVCMEGELEFNF